MLYQELPQIESTRLEGWGRWLAPALIAGVAVTAALLLLLAGQPAIAALVVAGVVVCWYFELLPRWAIAVLVFRDVFLLVVGLLAGYFRRVDAVVMRLMDGLMAIPAILLALALMAMMRGSVRNVVIALVIPEIPRVIRLVRASVLSLREHTMVEAARALGVGTPRILVRYVLPALVAPLVVQATYICASAILFEASLSFLGAGTPPHIPSWGNIMAEGKRYVQLAFWIILFPGLFLAATVLAINLVGDGLREVLDPHLSGRAGGHG